MFNVSMTQLSSTFFFWIGLKTDFYDQGDDAILRFSATQLVTASEGRFETLARPISTSYFYIPMEPQDDTASCK